MKYVVIGAAGAALALAGAIAFAPVVERHNARVTHRESVLVGTGCGPMHETMVAREEDQFPVEGCADIQAHWLED